MRTRDRIGLYCFLAFSIFVCEESWRLGLGNLHLPGPGFLPFGASAIIVVLAIIRLMLGRKQRVASKEPFFIKERLVKFLTVVAIIFGYGLMLYYIGFFLCTLLFVGISVRAIEPKKWWIVIGVSLGSAIVAWLLFDYWLMVPVPKGIWVSAIYEKIRGF